MRDARIHASQRRFVAFAWAFLAYTVAVALFGAYVRASMSGDGCGDHWPLCNGEVVPIAPTLKTRIELTHRVTSALCGLFAIGAVIGAYRLFPRGHLARLGAGLSLFFVITEGLVGAGLVLYRYVADSQAIERGYWMAAHLVNTFALLLVIALMALWASGQATSRRVGGLGAFVLVGLALVLVTGVSGAIAALGDTLFPATSIAEGLARDLDPASHIFLRLRGLHPVFALLTAGALVVAVGMVLGREDRPAVRRSAYGLGGLVLVQVAVGFANLALLAPIALQIVHLFLAYALWIAGIRMVALLAEPSPLRDLDAVEVEPAGA